MPRGRHTAIRDESDRLMALTTYDKTIVAGVLAAATTALAAIPFQHAPPPWAIIATAVLTPVAVFFKSNAEPAPEPPQETGVMTSWNPNTYSNIVAIGGATYANLPTTDYANLTTGVVNVTKTPSGYIITGMAETTGAHGVLPVIPKATPGVPLDASRSDKIFTGGQIPAPPEPNTAKYQPLVPPVTADAPNDPTT
jgi:hypothetical protein